MHQVAANRAASSHYKKAGEEGNAQMYTTGHYSMLEVCQMYHDVFVKPEINTISANVIEANSS